MFETKWALLAFPSIAGLILGIILFVLLQVVVVLFPAETMAFVQYLRDWLPADWH